MELTDQTSMSEVDAPTQAVPTTGVPAASLRGPGHPDRRLLIAIGIVAVLVLVVGVITLATSGSDDDKLTAADGSTTTTTAADAAVAAGESDDASAEPAAPTDDAAADEPAAPAATDDGGGASDQPAAAPQAADEDLGAPQDPGPTVPPTAGKYRYRVTTGDGEKTESPTTIKDKSRTGAETVQIISGKQGGLDASSEIAWTADKVVIRTTTFTFNGQDGKCDWEPDHLQAKLPMAKGSSWEATSSCTITGFGPTPIIVKRTSTAKVTGLDRRKVAGQVLDLWVIEGTEHIEFAGNVIDGTGKTWFSPKHGLIVRTEGSGSGGNATETQEGSFVSELLNLAPE